MQSSIILIHNLLSERWFWCDYNITCVLCVPCVLYGVISLSQYTHLCNGLLCQLLPSPCIWYGRRLLAINRSHTSTNRRRSIDKILCKLQLQSCCIHVIFIISIMVACVCKQLTYYYELLWLIICARCVRTIFCNKFILKELRTSFRMLLFWLQERKMPKQWLFREWKRKSKSNGKVIGNANDKWWQYFFFLHLFIYVYWSYVWMRPIALQHSQHIYE